MDIGKYKQAMSYLLNPDATLKTFIINPEAKLIDNDPKPIEGFASGGLAESFPELVKYLKSNEGNVINKSEIARKFNVSEDTLNRKIKQYDLDIKSGGTGGSLLSQTKLPKEELDIFNKGYKTKTISQMASEITGLPYDNKITKAKNAQLYRHLLTQQKLENISKEDVQRGTRPKGTTPEDVKGFNAYRKAQQDLMDLNPKAYKNMTPAMVDNELKKLLQFSTVRGAFNVKPELAPSFEHIQGIVPGTITQDPEALKKVGITTKRFNFDLLGAKSKEGIYKGIKNNLRTAREALKLGDKDQAKISLDLINKAYDQVVEDYKTLNRDELPFYKIKGDEIKETNVNGIVKQRTLKKSLSEYIKNVAAVADPEEIKQLQPNLKKAVNLFKKGEDVAAEKLIQSRVPAVKEGALFMHVIPGQESVFDYVKSIGSDIKAGKVVSPFLRVLAPVGTALGAYDVYENLKEGKPLAQSALSFVGADPLAQSYREQSRLSPESKEIQKKIRTEDIYKNESFVPGLDVAPPAMEEATDQEKIKLQKEQEKILSDLEKEENITAEDRKKLFDYILNRINPIQKEEVNLAKGGRIRKND